MLLLIPDLFPWNCIDFYCNHRVLFPSPYQPRVFQPQIALTGDGAASLSLSNSDILRVDIVLYGACNKLKILTAISG
jgi:hypothetical protein